MTIASLLCGIERNLRGSFDAELGILDMEHPALGGDRPIEPEANLRVLGIGAESSVRGREGGLLIADQSRQRRVGDGGIVLAAEFDLKPSELVVALDRDGIDLPRRIMVRVIRAQPLPCAPGHAKS